MININAKNFTKEVLLSDIPVVVDVWADWCAPCQKLEPILTEIEAEKLGVFKVVKLNSDENSSIVATFSIRSIPTILIFKKGELVKRMLGAHTKTELLKEIEEVI